MEKKTKLHWKYFKANNQIIFDCVAGQDMPKEKKSHKLDVQNSSNILIWTSKI